MKFLPKQKWENYSGDPEQRYWMPVLDAAQMLWESTTGSSDVLVEGHQRQVARFLRDRLQSWKIGSRWAERYDEAVRQVLLEALMHYVEETKDYLL